MRLEFYQTAIKLTMLPQINTRLIRFNCGSDSLLKPLDLENAKKKARGVNGNRNSRQVAKFRHSNLPYVIKDVVSGCCLGPWGGGGEGGER